MIHLKNTKTNNNNEINLFINKAFNPTINTVLFIGVTHGDEQQGEYLINKLVEQSEIETTKNNLLFIPCFNPDGKDLNQRGNANGVDLNRNFPTKNWELGEKNEFFGGTAPASELETQFMVEVIKDYKPNLIYSIHAPFEIVNYDGPAKEIAEQISNLTPYPVQEDIGYPTPGSFGTYCGVERNIATITIELPENIDNETLWKYNKDAMIHVANYQSIKPFHPCHHGEFI